MIYLFCLSLIFILMFGDSLSNYDFTPLQKKGAYSYAFTSPIANVRWNFHQQPTSACNDSKACTVFLQDSTICLCIGSLSDEKVTVLTNSYGLNFSSFNNISTVIFSSEIFLLCASEETVSGTLASTLVHINYTSPYGCRIDDKLYPGYKAKISWGWVFIIILSILTFVYLVGGSLIFKFVLHKEGIEIIPFVYFWVSIPRLTFEGAKFLVLWIKHKIQSAHSGAYIEVI